MELPDLPDDVILHVLAFLASRELLLCRAVCRRWRALALRPELWRAHCFDSDADCGLFNAVLRLAPCARHLDFNWDFFEDARYFELTRTTSCAAHALSLVCDCTALTTDVAAGGLAILSNQRVLGRVQELDLYLYEARGGIVNFINETKLLDGLKHLGIFSTFEFENLPESTRRALLLNPWEQVALTRLRYRYRGGDDPLLLSLLQSQAATLQMVFIFPDVNRNCSAVLASTLAAMANLEALRCRPLEHMADLLRCRNLRRLYLDCYIPTPHGSSEAGQDVGRSAVADTEAFLRHATHITELTLGFYGVESEVLNFLSALAASGRCGVSTLTMEAWGVTSFHLTPLLGAAPRLPHLQIVDLDTFVSLDYLRELAAAASSLRVIKFRLNTDTCAHAWMHLPAVESLLRGTPALHLMLLPEGPCSKHTCPDSTLGCHQGLKSSMIGCSEKGVESQTEWSNLGLSTAHFKRIGLFGHPLQDVCPFHFDYPPIVWFYIHGH